MSALCCVVLARAEMEMVRESRERDKESGVDRNACIVDRNQFFNTQVRPERGFVTYMLHVRSTRCNRRSGSNVQEKNARERKALTYCPTY